MAHRRGRTAVSPCRKPPEKAESSATSSGQVLVVPALHASSDDMIEGTCLIYHTLGEDFNKSPLALAGLGGMSRRRIRAQYELARNSARRAGITCIDQFDQLIADDEPMEIDF